VEVYIVNINAEKGLGICNWVFGIRLLDLIVYSFEAKLKLRLSVH
jgi:hypothetical protein